MQVKNNSTKSILKQLDSIIGIEKCKDDKYTLSSNVKQMLVEYFDVERTKDTFSNARLVRNLFEKIKIMQAQRVITDADADVNLLTIDDVKTTLEYLTKQQITNQKHTIGFII